MNLESERRRLIFHLKVAHTPQQIRALKAPVNAWRSRQPEDAVIERAARQLALSEFWLKKNGQWH
jgi:hypothetical protein